MMVIQLCSSGSNVVLVLSGFKHFLKLIVARTVFAYFFLIYFLEDTVQEIPIKVGS